MNISTNNIMNNDMLITVLFKSPKCANLAYNYLTSAGFDKNDITVIMSKETRDQNFKDVKMPEDSLGSKAVEGMGLGSAVGGTVGAVAAAIAAIGTSVMIPGLGLVIAGPIAAALVGAGTGSAIGSIVGGLVGLGISDEEAKLYEDDIKKGGILIGVKASNERFDELRNELNKLNM